MLFLRATIVAAIGALAIGFVAHAGDDHGADARKDLVHRFVAAFNAQDADAMAGMVTDDVEWLSVDGKSVLTETAGKAALRASMVDYFKSCPTCRSTLASVGATRDRVTTIEVATWQSSKGRNEQRGIAVYEFAGPLIRRVYYFPAER